MLVLRPRPWPKSVARSLRSIQRMFTALWPCLPHSTAPTPQEHPLWPIRLNVSDAWDEFPFGFSVTSTRVPSFTCWRRGPDGWHRDLEPNYEPPARERLEIPIGNGAVRVEHAILAERLDDLAAYANQLHSAVTAIVGEHPTGRRRASEPEPTAGGAEGRQPPEAAARTPQAERPEPSKKAFQAYHVARVLAISNQTDIAAEMVRQGVKATQGQVSKWLKSVEVWKAAGGMIPTVDELNAKPQAVDPAILDMGPRQDRRTPRQRLRRDPEADSDDE
jgi:hypothetical protein